MNEPLSINCQFVRTDEDKVLTCTQCGIPIKVNAEPNKVTRNCLAAKHLWPKIPDRRTAAQRIGPGTELKMMLSRLGLASTPGCKCNQRAQVMDMEGPDWCEGHIEEICDWMEEEANKRGLPFIRLAARIMIRRAISKARKKIAMLEQP